VSIEATAMGTMTLKAKYDGTVLDTTTVAVAAVPDTFTVDDYTVQPGTTTSIPVNWFLGTTALDTATSAGGVLKLSATNSPSDAKSCAWVSASSAYECGPFDTFTSAVSHTFYGWADGTAIGSDSTLFQTGSPTFAASSVSPSTLERDVPTTMVLHMVDQWGNAYRDNAPTDVSVKVTLAGTTSTDLTCTYNSTDGTWGCGDFTLPYAYDSATLDAHVTYGVSPLTTLGTYTISTPLPPSANESGMNAAATAEVDDTVQVTVDLRNSANEAVGDLTGVTVAMSGAQTGSVPATWDAATTTYKASFVASAEGTVSLSAVYKTYTMASVAVAVSAKPTSLWQNVVRIGGIAVGAVTGTAVAAAVAVNTSATAASALPAKISNFLKFGKSATKTLPM
ncbi:hypothetical protein KIPB_008580, partial [Kipferlia bialata]